MCHSDDAVDVSIAGPFIPQVLLGSLAEHEIIPEKKVVLNKN